MKYSPPASRLSLRTRPLRTFALCAILLACVQGASAGWLEDQITTIQSRLSTLQKGMNNTYAKANTAATQAVLAAKQTNGLSEVIARIQDAYSSLDGPAVDRIEDQCPRITCADPRAGAQRLCPSDHPG